MTENPAHPPGTRRLNLLLGALSVGIVVVACCIVAWVVNDAWREAHRQSNRQIRGIERTVRHNIDRVIGSIDLSLLAIVKALETPGFADIPSLLQQTTLFADRFGTPGFVGVSVTDEAGRALFRSEATLASTDLADRPYFQAVRDSLAPGPYISPPFLFRTRQVTGIAIVRRANHPDGRFAGAGTAYLNLSYFETLFAHQDLDPHTVLALYDANRHLIARWPQRTDPAAPQDDPAPLFDRLAQQAGQNNADVSFIKRAGRSYAFGRVEALPLVLSVSCDNADIFAGSSRRITVVVLTVFSLTALALLLIALFARTLRRHAEAERQALQAERNAVATVNRLDALFQASSDSMLVASVGTDGRIVYEAVNRVWENLTGVAAATAIGRTPHEVLPLQLADRIAAVWATCVQEKRKVEISFKLPANLTRDWDSVVAPVFSADGQIRRLIAITRDMTDRNRTEEALRHTQRIDAVGQLAGGLAHDFNNLLQAISGAAEILQHNAGLGPQDQECLATVRDATTHGATLVHRLLAFARKQILTPTMLQPQKLLTDFSALLKHTLGPNVQIEFSVDENVGMVNADAAQLESCLLNLALNASDAMPHGGTIRLSADNADAHAARAAGLPANDYVRFTFADTGIGMSLDIQARAFEPFFTTKGVGRGSGLGLSMVQGFAMQSGGEVLLDSHPGKGTSVNLWLPLATPSKQPAPTAAIPPRVEKQGSQRRILLVDDSVAIRRTLSIMLKFAGFIPVVADNAEAALALLHGGEQPVLLITDQSMPGMSGTALIAEVARLRPELPAILISGHDLMNDMAQPSAKMIFLHKPFEWSVLLHHIETLLNHAATEAPGAESA